MSSCFISAENIVLSGNIFPISELIRRQLKTRNSQNSHRATPVGLI
uniref:GG16490 n=1 Tax=Drosophila erecta TaxID=7220 RepID=B3NZC0_DROER